MAATAVAELPSDILNACASKARTSCTHHGQIVPAILAESRDWLEMRRRTVAPATIPVDRRIEQEEWSPDAAEIEAIKREVANSLRANRP